MFQYANNINIFNMNNKLLDILKYGIIEIRVLSSKTNEDIKRINELSNILHNIPDMIMETNQLSEDKTNFYIIEYCNKYPSSLLNKFVK